MVRLSQVPFLLRQLASRVSDFNALRSGNPVKITRHWGNKLIGRVLRGAEKRCFLRGKK